MVELVTVFDFYTATVSHHHWNLSAHWRFINQIIVIIIESDYYHLADCGIWESLKVLHEMEYQYVTNCFSEAKALVPGASNKLGEWVIEYAIFLHVLSQQWRPQKQQNLAQR